MAVAYPMTRDNGEERPNIVCRVIVTAVPNAPEAYIPSIFYHDP